MKPKIPAFTLQSGKSKKDKEQKQLDEAFKSANEMAGKEVELEAFWKPADKKDRVSHETLVVLKATAVKISEAGTDEKKSP